jgi:hypothetical protein
MEIELSGEKTPHPGRGSATAAETQAAEIVRKQLQRLGIADVRTQEFQGLRSIWLFFSLAFGVALGGHAAFWLLSRPTGLWAALAVSLGLFGFSGFLLWRKLTFQSHPYSQALPHGPSQNVLAVLPPAQAAARKVVLLAHLDSHRAVFWYSHDLLVRLYRPAVALTIYGVFAAPLLYALADLTGWMGFAWAGAGFALVHFAAWLTGLTADLGPYSPGANDNASAVGSLLALAERLQQEPLQHTEVWLAFTGCEESGCGGLLELLKAHGAELKDALWIDLELVGIGEQVGYVAREGVLRRPRLSPDLAQRVQAALPPELKAQPVDWGWHGVFTEAGALWLKGYRAVCVTCRRRDSDLLPEWHRLSDTPDRLEAAALGQAHTAAWELLQVNDLFSAQEF